VHDPPSCVTCSYRRYRCVDRSFVDVVVCFLCFAFFAGHGGLFRRFLSADFWVPFARLTYAAYLYHPIIIITYYSSREVLPLYVTTEVVLYFFGFASLAFVVSFFHFLLFEKPTMNLEAMFLH